MAHEIHLQLEKTYILINLKKEFPQKIIYRSLSNNGFNYNPATQDHIITHEKNTVIKILENSRHHRLINSKTVDNVIDLINGIKSLR
ncbi:hypothetical protein [Elizabethkingia meningoseptica]|uniref:hypothetical protein n=1 Tax=Elizabethkingia meningoseptica TaxID=238 RepID=UPI000B35E7F3|nr:hypothetical protein [Elizabethkingia meningoseptica]